MNIWNTVYNVNKLYLHPGSGWTNMFIHNNGTWRVGFFSPDLHCSLNNDWTVRQLGCAQGVTFQCWAIFVLEGGHMCPGVAGKGGKENLNT